jgi:stress response protein YsnF
MMSSVLIGIFESESAAMQARTRLLAAGFAESDVEMTGGSSMSSGSSGGSPSSADEREQEGPIARFFRSLFGDDEDDRRSVYSDTYGEAVRRGNWAVTVTASDEADVDRAERLLNECGAIDVDERSHQWRSEGWTGGVWRSGGDGMAAQDRGLTRGEGAASTGAQVTGATVTGATRAAGANEQATTALDAGTHRTLREVEEELKIGKRAVARGGVRVFTRLSETPVEESVRLREEHAEVQRREVDRPATEADLAAFQEGSIEVRETAEEAVVSKTARVVGEVEVGKTVTEREETVRDTVRRTQVEVEPIEGGGRREGVMAEQGALSGERMRASERSMGRDAGMATAMDDRGSAVRTDRDTGADGGPLGSHPVGTGVGAVAGGMAAGAAVGTAAGPVGTVAGAAAGAVAGGLAGKAVAEEVDDDDDEREDRDRSR